jgi:hypothetical protein
MQWSCPHCGINLAVSDETLNSGWSFSRCYKCGGFALVRKTEINVIKVDKAPPGERIILPEASGDPSRGLMNEAATQRLAQHKANSKPTSTPPKKPDSIPSTGQLTQQGSFPPAALSNPNSPLFKLPDPLPDLSSGRTKAKTIPAGITFASILAVGSGIYLFVQGQVLWQKVKESSASRTEKALQQKVISQFPASISSHEKQEIVSPPGLLDNENFGHAETVAVVSQKQNSPLITDRVQQRAMAPAKDNTAEKGAKPSILVKLKGKAANFHSGPGMNFPITGSLAAEVRYQVLDWNDRWLKVTSQSASLASDSGWVRNDLVERIATPNLNPLY